MLKILIAEDDQELRQLFAHVLRKNGYQVEGVSNGQEALDALDNTYFDLIISDVMMPQMDGYTLVSQLREAGINTPVLMVTAKDAFDDMRQGFLSGKLPHHHHVRGIVQQLEHAGEHQGQREADDLGQQRAAAHVHFIMTALTHTYPLPQ